MLFLCYPKCSTCQKAKAWLDERGISYELRDIKTDNPTAEELTLWYRKSGLPLKKFFNTSGLQYKALGLKDKLPDRRGTTSAAGHGRNAGKAPAAGGRQLCAHRLPSGGMGSGT